MQRRRERAIQSAAAALGMLLVIHAGCGHSGPERALVSGAVTYRGTAVAEGVIRFIPCDDTKGPTMTAPIVGGRYKIETWGGIPLGSYRVDIAAMRERAGVSGTRVTREDAYEQYIPAKYNTKTELTTTIEPGQHTLTRDFTLTD